MLEEIFLNRAISAVGTIAMCPQGSAVPPRMFSSVVVSFE